jgi:hypothetical protein
MIGPPKKQQHLPSGYLTVCHGKLPIEIDGLPFLKMVDL